MGHCFNITLLSTAAKIQSVFIVSFNIQVTRMTRKKKISLGVLGLLIVLPVTAWFVGKSEFFIKKAILPRVAASLGAEIDADSISLHPFSSLDLTGVTFKQKGKVDAKIGKIKTRYNLMSFLKKAPVISQCLIEDGDIIIHLPLTAKEASDFKPSMQPSEEPAGASTPPQLDIQNVTLKNIRITAFMPGKNKGKIHIDNLSLHIPAIKNGEPLNLKVTCDKIMAGLPGGVINTDAVTLQSTINLSNDLFPESINSELNITGVSGLSDQSVDTRLTANASFKSPTHITLDTFNVTLGPAGKKALYVLEGTGSVNTKATDFQYMLSLSSKQVINLTDLQSLLTAQTTEPKSATRPGINPVKTKKAPEKSTRDLEKILLPPLPSDISAKVNISLAGVILKDYTAENINVSATLKDGVLTIPGASLVALGTPVKIDAVWDASETDNQRNSSHVELGKTAAGKILSILQPSFPATVTGGFDSLSLQFTTKGRIVSQLLENLRADSQLRISGLTVKSRPSSTAGLQASQLNYDAMTFNSGELKLVLDRGVMNIKASLDKMVASLPDGDMTAGPFTLTSIVNLSARLLPESIDSELTLADIKGVYCQPIDTRFTTKALFNFPGRVTLNSFMCALGPAGEAPLCELDAKGSFDMKEKDFPFTFSLSSRQVINVTDIQRLFTVGDSASKPGISTKSESESTKGTGDDGATAGAEKPLPAIPPGISGKVDISLPGIIYDPYDFKTINLTATLKDGVLSIPGASLVALDAPVRFTAVWDTKKPDNQQITSHVELGKTPAGRILSKLRPSFPVVFTGGFENLSARMSTQGATVNDALENLTADSQFNISSLTVKSMPAWAEQLSRSVLRLFSLSRDDLSFHGGRGNLGLNQGIVDVKDLSLDGALWRLNMLGTVPLEGSPELTLIPAFRGTSARKLADQGISLDQENEGFQAAPPLDLKGDIWNPHKALTAVPLLVLNYSAQLRAGSSELKAVNDGVNILKDVVKQPDTITKDPGKILRGAFDIYQDIEKKKNEKDTTKEKKAAPPKPEEQVIDSLLKGIFGK